MPHPSEQPFASGDHSARGTQEAEGLCSQHGESSGKRDGAASTSQTFLWCVLSLSGTCIDVRGRSPPSRVYVELADYVAVEVRMVEGEHVPFQFQVGVWAVAFFDRW